ncbi:MAG: hypothetical protein Q9174_006091, partial [Haloplaca sp. 1 TL-2023]
MSRPQDVYFDYHTRQQHLRERARAPSRRSRRRWPPSPSAEEEWVSLAYEFRPAPPDAGGREARSRGSLDQQPIILDVEQPSSNLRAPPKKESELKQEHSIGSNEGSTSSDSSEPDTPMDTDSEEEDQNRDQRYVFIPKKGVEIPLTYDEPRTPIHGKHSHNHPPSGADRGRRNVPKLDTDFARAKSMHEAPLNLERERSPYRSAPRPKETRTSGEFLLSPEAMTPRNRHNENTAPITSSTPQRAYPEVKGFDKQAGITPRSPARPSMVRHASAMAYPGAKSPSPKEHTSIPYTNFVPSLRNDIKPGPSNAPSPCRSSAMPSERLTTLTSPLSANSRQASVPPPKNLSISTEKPQTTFVASPISTEPQSLNAMLSSPTFEHGRRRASPRNSPRASPSSSPLSSPPRTPPAEISNRKPSYFESAKIVGSNARPCSPLHPPPSPRLMNYSGYESDVSRSSRPVIRARQTTPLPPAARSHLEPAGAPEINVRSPSPANHRRSSTYGGDSARSRSQRPSPVVDHSVPESRARTLKPGGLEHRRRSSSAVDGRPRSTVDPVQSESGKASTTSQSRYLSLQSPSTTRAASVGAPPATLPPCPRSVPLAGYNDWYCLRDCSTFKICPSCRAAVDEAGYGRHLTAVFSKPPDRPIKCSLSIPWNRMAYLLMLKKRKSDIDLLYDMADIADDTPPCTGKRPAQREWYRIADIDSDRNVPGFYACPYCIQSLETIFPVLKGVFHKSTRSSHRHFADERTCSLGSDSSRFATYVDLLEDTAAQAVEFRRPPNTYRFVELARSMGQVPGCKRDDMLRDAAWHILPKIPEFTICDECYEDVIWPAVLQGSTLASKVGRKMER